MTRHTDHRLILNGIEYAGEALQNLCKEKLNDPSLHKWEHRLFDFILDWMRDKDFIEVKTSGSTGTPKNIRLEKQHMINSASLTGKVLGLKEGENALLCLSTDFIAGKMMVVRAMVNGYNLICAEPTGYPLSGVTEKIDFAAMVPLQVVNSIAEVSDLQKLKDVRTLIIGGGPADHKLTESIRSFPNRVFATYGMTESCTHIALRRLNGPSPDDLYKILPGIKIKSDDRDCLVVDAPAVSPVELHTNDIVRIVDENTFEITGRFDNIINSGGVKHSPEKIEKKLAHIIRQQFFISSLPDPKFGEKLILVIEAKQDDIPDISRLRSDISKIVDPLEVPKQIELTDSFYLTESGKIDRKRIMEKLKI